jgi:TolA-binding protein
MGKYEKAVELYRSLKEFSRENVVEKCKLCYHMGFSLTKMKKFHEAEAEFRAVTKEYESKMHRNDILVYVWKSYE